MHHLTVPPTGRGDPLAPLLDLPGLPIAVTEATDAVDRLLAHRVLRRGSAAVSSESALRGARASAALEGADLDLAQVRQGLGGPVVRGALRVSAQLGTYVEVWSRAPGQVLAALHMLAARELTGADRLGRPSAGAEAVFRLEALCALLAGPVSVPAVVLAGVVHGELLTLAPFAAGNGVVARAASRLTMVSRGLDPKAVSVPEAGHAELAGAYADCAAGYASGEPAGVAAWLRHCCAAVVLGAREGLAICEAALRA